AAAAISFIDDVKSQPAGLRFFIHFSAVLLLFYSIGLFAWPMWLWLPAIIVSIGALNAFNFMDGINGITGVYALVMLLTFWYINSLVEVFTYPTFIIIQIVSILIFLFF